MTVTTDIADRQAPRWRWGLLGALAALEVVLIILARQGRAPTGGDLCRDYVSAMQLLHGHSPYDLSTACGILRFSPHPPLAILVLVPVTLLPAPAIAYTWDLLMLAALIGALAIIWAEALPHLPPQWVLVGLGLLAFWPPLLDTWLQAQNGPLILLLLVLAWWARRHNQPVAAGFWLAIAVLIRVYPVLLFLVPLLRREWRLVLSGMATGVGVTLLTLPFIGPADYWHYLTVDGPGASADWINDAHNVSYRGWLADLFIGNNTVHPVISAPGLVTPLYFLGIIVLIGFLLTRRRLDELSWLLAIPVFLTISPLAWPHYFIVLLLPWLVVVGRLTQLGIWGRSGWLLTASVACLFLNTLGRLTAPLPRLLPWPYGVLLFVLPFYGLVLTMAAMVSVPGETRINRYTADAGK